jgi:hypothetical protein
MNQITGGAGFIGSHLLAALLGEGEEVRVLERRGANVDHLLLDRIELVSAHIRDQAAMAWATRDCSHVYHLAADPNLWRRDLREYDAINYQGALNVIHAALGNGALCSRPGGYLVQREMGHARHRHGAHGDGHRGAPDAPLHVLRLVGEPDRTGPRSKAGRGVGARRRRLASVARLAVMNAPAS